MSRHSRPVHIGFYSIEYITFCLLNPASECIHYWVICSLGVEASYIAQADPDVAFLWWFQSITNIFFWIKSFACRWRPWLAGEVLVDSCAFVPSPCPSSLPLLLSLNISHISLIAVIVVVGSFWFCCTYTPLLSLSISLSLLLDLEVSDLLVVLPVS